MSDRINAYERIEFTNADRQDPTWLKLKLHLEGRLEFLRARNDGALDQAETATVRGGIAEIKSILAIAQERPRM